MPIAPEAGAAGAAALGAGVALAGFGAAAGFVGMGLGAALGTEAVIGPSALSRAAMR